MGYAKSPTNGKPLGWSPAIGGHKAIPPRLSKDYEVLPSSEEAWIYVAMIRVMLRRLAQNSS
jgi:hypothetical protein